MSIKSAVATARTPRISKKPKHLSRTHQPDDLSLRDWQISLRRQFGREAPLEIRNLGKAPVFSEFSVTNPDSKRSYRVAIRGITPGFNFCSCPDYSVNTLGTCKHIEAVLGKLERGHKTVLQAGYVPPFAEVYVRYGLRRQVVFSPGKDCPGRLRRLAAKYFDESGNLRAEAYGDFDEFAKRMTAEEFNIKIYDDAAAMIAEERDRAARQVRLERRFGGKAPKATWQGLLTVPLHPYQREGALFAAKAGRAIIADEMGLGKTIQAIAAAEILARDVGLERVLIICPASLKSQWHYEIGRFSKRDALIINGPTHERARTYQKESAFFKIVNYDVIHRDLEAIAAWSPDLVILDEAQRIKNWATRAARTVKQIQSPFALVLTGTPLENRLDELHSIVEFVDRHRLGPLFAFKAAHEQREKDSTRVVGYRDLNKINQSLAPILIRRTKQEVLSQLPPRMDKNFFVPMTEPQWAPHNENREIVGKLVKKWARYRFLCEADQLRLRIALQNMRMACDSTYLVDHETKHQTKVSELANVLEETFERPDNKVVIFSQWTRMNELVMEMLDDRKWGYVHLHGGVPSHERQNLTRALREDADCRVFLSTDAGGVGLNLQTASTVVNMDLPWNPAVLEQRIGRVHRMGQKDPVRVVNFISEHTIEHGMLSLLRFKRSVFAGVLDGTADKVFMGEGALSRFMKTVETATSAIPDSMRSAVEDEEPSPEATMPNSNMEPIESRPDQKAGVPLDALLAMGAQLLQSFSAALQPAQGGNGHGKARLPAANIVADPVTSQKELRIRLPNEDVLRTWLGEFSNCIRSLTA